MQDGKMSSAETAYECYCGTTYSLPLVECPGCGCYSPQLVLMQEGEEGLKRRQEKARKDFSEKQIKAGKWESLRLV